MKSIFDFIMQASLSDYPALATSGYHTKLLCSFLAEKLASIPALQRQAERVRKCSYCFLRLGLLLAVTPQLPGGVVQLLPR